MFEEPNLITYKGTIGTKDTNHTLGVGAVLVPVVGTLAITTAVALILWDTAHDSVSLLEVGDFRTNLHDSSGTFVRASLRQLSIREDSIKHHAVCVAQRRNGSLHKQIIVAQLLWRLDLVDLPWLLELHDLHGLHFAWDT